MPLAITVLVAVTVHKYTRRAVTVQKYTRGTVTVQKYAISDYSIGA